MRIDGDIYYHCLGEVMETDGLLTSCGGTSDPVGHIGPEDQWNGEFQKKPIKEEEPDDEEYFCKTRVTVTKSLINPLSELAQISDIF